MQNKLLDWINNNGDSQDQIFSKKMWEKYAPAQFKELFARNLNKVPIEEKVKSVLRNKTRYDITELPGN